MLKVTQAAISEITKEIQGLIDQGKKPLIRLSMRIG